MEDKSTPQPLFSVQCLGHRKHRYQASHKPGSCRVCGNVVACAEIKDKKAKEKFYQGFERRRID